MKTRLSVDQNENNNQKDISTLKEEIDILKQKSAEATQLSIQNKNESIYYKNLVDCKFKECSSLAEEIICLRTDLDRAHSNFLRLQRERQTSIFNKSQQSSSEWENKEYRLSNLSNLSNQEFEQEEEKVLMMNQNKSSNFYSFSEKEPFKQKFIDKIDDTEEDSPIPEQFKIFPISKIRNT